MIAAEREHRHRVVPDAADRAGRGRRGFRAHCCAEIDAVVPVAGFEYKRHVARSPAAEQKSTYGHALRIFPHWIDAGTLGGGRGETGVRVCGRRHASAPPFFSMPVNEPLGRRVRHAFPPDVVLFRERDVRENRILRKREHGIGVGLHGGAWGHSEKTVFRIDCAELSVGTGLDPGNVIADRPDAPALERRWRDQHGKVCLSAGARKSRGNVGFAAVRRFNAGNEHVLGHPTAVARHFRGDAQGKTFFSKQRIAAVTAAIGPDRAVFRKMNDVFVGRVAWPGHIALAGRKRCSHRVQAWYEGARGAEGVKRALAHSCHDAHVADDVKRVGDFNAGVGNRRTDRPHAERNHVHRAPAHRALEQPGERGFHFNRVGPVVGRARIFLEARADEGPVLHARDIIRI